MSTKWITNTVYLQGFRDSKDMFSFVATVREHVERGSEIRILDTELIDLEYLAINVSNIQTNIRISLNFLTTHDVAKEHARLITAGGFDHLKLTYAVINTKTDAVELYTFQGPELSSHKSVPKGLGKPLREDLERLPDPALNVSFPAGDLYELTYERFHELIRPLFPESFD